MRITHIDSRSTLAFAAVLAAVMVVLDLVVVLLLWITLSAMGILAALGIGLGLPTVLVLGLMLGLGHGAATGIVVWLSATAFNISTGWTGGLSVRTDDSTQTQKTRVDDVVVLPDTTLGAGVRRLLEQVSIHRPG